MSAHEKINNPSKLIKDVKTEIKFWERCPFCRLRRKLQTEIKKLVKERLENDRKT